MREPVRMEGQNQFMPYTVTPARAGDIPRKTLEGVQSTTGSRTLALVVKRGGEVRCPGLWMLLQSMK
jgi:hypothetical protein